MSIKVIHPYIAQKDGIQGGIAIISGTRTPVKSIVFHHQRGNAPEEILEMLPHLTLSQIYDALSYYYDHQKTIDGEMEADTEENIRHESGL